jgi:DNA-binding CsgD family transcriptional regulator/PAS domain-containing protein
MLDDATLQRMSITAYEAATDATRWHVLLEDMRSSFNATTVSIFTPLVGADQRLLTAASGMDRDAQALVARWAPHDPWLQTRLAQRLPLGTGATAIGSEYLPWPQLERTDFYRECARRVGIQGLLSMVVEGDGGPYGVPRTHLALTREPGQPEFGAQEATFLKALGRPLRGALQSYFALERLQSVTRSVRDCYEAVALPLFVLDAQGRLLYANPAGAAIVRGGVVVKLVHDRLTAIGNLHGDALQHILAAADAGFGRPNPLWWVDAGDVHTGMLQISRYAPQAAAGDEWSTARLVVVLELDAPSPRKIARLSALASRHGLTPAETRVLACIGRGLRPEAIAQSEALSVATVRTHIAHMLRKTGASGTFDLVRLIGG